MVNITNLEAQVQARINALSGSETLEQLLEVKRASEFINVDTTALDSAIETRIASFNSASNNVDLLLGNRLAINPYEKSLPVIPASEMKAHTADPSNTNLMFGLKTVDLAGVDATSGLTVDLTGRGIITYININFATTNDNKYSLTADGKVVSRRLDTFGGAVNNTILQVGGSIFQNFAGVGLLYENNASLYVETNTDTSVSISLYYVELEP